MSLENQIYNGSRHPGDFINLCRVELTDFHKLRFIGVKLLIFRDMLKLEVAPVVLASGPPTPLPLRRRLRPMQRTSRCTSLTAPQTLSFGPSGLRPSCPNARDCSTAAPLTARQSGKPACPAILRFPYELCGFGVALQIVLQKGVDNLIHPGIVADAGIVHP